MDVEPETIITGLFALATILLVLRALLSSCLPAIGCEFYRGGTAGGPSDLDPADKDAHYADFHRQLLALGFVPLGVTWAKLIGKPRSTSYAFAHPRESCWALVWRMLGGDFRVLIVSQFTNGSAVLTSNYTRPLQCEPGYLARGVPTHSLALVLEEHRRDAAAFRAAGSVPWAYDTLEDVVEAKRAYHFQPTARRHYRRASTKTFLSRLGAAVPPIACAAVVVLSGGEPLIASALAFVGTWGWTVEWRQQLQKVLAQKTLEQQRADVARGRPAVPEA